MTHLDPSTPVFWHGSRLPIEALSIISKVSQRFESAVGPSSARMTNNPQLVPGQKSASGKSVDNQ